MTNKVKRNGPLARMAWAVFLFMRHFLRKELRYGSCNFARANRNAEGRADLLLGARKRLSSAFAAWVFRLRPGPARVHRIAEPLHGRGISADYSGHAGTWAVVCATGVAVIPKFSAWRHDEAAADMFALLDHLGMETFEGIG